MRRQIVGWSIAFVLTSAAAALVSVSACRDVRVAPAPPPRDPAELSDIEVELILNRIREGDLHALRGDIESARHAWAKARRMGEGLWPIHEGLGDSLARVDRHREAVGEYEVAEQLVPDRLASVRASIAFKRAGVLAAAGRPREAVQAYLECRVPLRTEQAILELVEKDGPSEIVPVVEEFARIHDPRVYRMVSEIHARLDREVDAAAALAKYCIYVAPWDAALNRQAVARLRKVKHWDEAIEVCRAWVKSAPETLEAYRLMGDLHREAGRERNALISYTSIVDVRPGDAAAHRLLGGLLRDMDRRDEAIRQYEAARRARPEDRDSYLLLFKLYRQRGDFTGADSMLEEYGRRFGLTEEMKRSLLPVYERRLAALRAQADDAGVREVRRRLADLDIPELGLFDLKIVMTWDSECDVDLHVLQPDKENVYYQHTRSKAGGVYHVDDQKGTGAETYTLKRAPAGTYRVSARLFAGQKATARFVVLLYEGTPREERREQSVLLQGKGDEEFIHDLVLTNQRP